MRSKYRWEAGGLSSWIVYYFMTEEIACRVSGLSQTKYVSEIHMHHLIFKRTWLENGI